MFKIEEKKRYRYYFEEYIKGYKLKRFHKYSYECIIVGISSVFDKDNHIKSKPVLHAHT